MKLLIVVSKLLTGFDAPSCTYIYLDNELRDHNLFQAICRTNRLDGDDKDYGHIIDFKPYEADMRHLLNTYIQADPAADLGGLGEMSLTELIIETGIHDAIARKLNEKGKLSKNAIAEGIINNVRKTIIREQLTDPGSTSRCPSCSTTSSSRTGPMPPRTKSSSGRPRRW